MVQIKIKFGSQTSMNSFISNHGRKLKNLNVNLSDVTAMVKIEDISNIIGTIKDGFYSLASDEIIITI